MKLNSLENKVGRMFLDVIKKHCIGIDTRQEPTITIKELSYLISLAKKCCYPYDDRDECFKVIRQKLNLRGRGRK